MCMDLRAETVPQCPGFSGIELQNQISIQESCSFEKTEAPDLVRTKLIRQFCLWPAMLCRSSVVIKLFWRSELGIKAQRWESLGSWPKMASRSILNYKCLYPCNVKFDGDGLFSSTTAIPGVSHLSFCSRGLCSTLLWLPHFCWSCGAHSAWHRAFSAGSAQLVVTIWTLCTLYEY